MKLLVLDIETSGPHMLYNFIVSIGACVVDIKTEQVLVEHDFEIYLKQPADRCFDKQCFDEFWNKPFKHGEKMTRLEKSNERGTEIGMLMPHDAMYMFAHYVSRVFKTFKHEEVHIITDTAGFDIGWLNYYLNMYFPRNRLFTSLETASGHYIAPRDMTSYNLGLLQRPLNANVTDKDLQYVADKKFSKYQKKQRHNHNPLVDAKCIGMRAAFVLNFTCEEKE